MAQVNRDRPLVPTFDIALSSERMRQLNLATTHVEVDHRLGVPGRFRFRDRTEAGQPNAIPWQDAEEFRLGANVEVSLGYHGQEVTPVIHGQIAALESGFRSAEAPWIEVRGYDACQRLNGPRQTRTFLGLKDSDIATRVCQEAQVDVDATDSGVTHDFIAQANQTDWQFLCARAQRIGFELLMVDKTLLFRPVADDGEVVLTLSFRDDLLEFQPCLSMMPLTELQVRAWDLKRKDMFLSVAEADPGQGSIAGKQSGATQTFAAFNEARIETLPEVVASQAEADRLAHARFNSASLRFITGSGRARGRPDLRAGSVIEIADIGPRFAGRYYVTSAVHSYTPAGYITRFEVQRNAS